MKGYKFKHQEKKGKKKPSPTLLRRLTPTLWAWTDPAIVTHGTPIYNDSHVVVVPAYGKVSKLHKIQIRILKNLITDKKVRTVPLNLSY